jgi:hypothetical protein
MLCSPMAQTNDVVALTAHGAPIAPAMHNAKHSRRKDPASPRTRSVPLSQATDSY